MSLGLHPPKDQPLNQRFDFCIQPTLGRIFFKGRLLDEGMGIDEVMFLNLE